MASFAPDLVIRALTDDGSFRVLTARTTGLCREAVQKQGTSGETARHFGDLLTGTVLVRETMAPTLRVQGVVRGAQVLADLLRGQASAGESVQIIQSPVDHLD